MELSLLEGITYFSGLGLHLEEEVHKALKKAGEIVLEEAQDEIGAYQGAAGPTAAWDELAPTTKVTRVNEGFTENDPLLRTGHLRDSLSLDIEGDTAFVGSDDPVAVFQELGTATIPPRSFLVGAAYRKETDVIKAVDGAVTIAIK